MEGYKEIQNGIKKLKETKAKIEEQKKNSIKADEEFVDFAVQCATFNESIIYYISALLRVVEDKRYNPYIYKNIIHEANQGNYDTIEEVSVGIAEDKYLFKFIRENKMDISELFEKKQAFGLLIKERKIISKGKVDIKSSFGTYNYQDHDYNKYAETITFGFLLNEVGIESTEYAVSNYNFYDKPYVQNFIRYLFNLQVQKSGMKLSGDEVCDAYDEYITYLKNQNEKDKNENKKI